MFRKVCFVSCLLFIIDQNVECAMKKSWKSAANFDDKIPKFSPFDNEGDLMNKAGTKSNALRTKISDATSSLPLTETLSTKISSKIKKPSRYVADIYKQFHQDMKHKQSHDFGSFNVNMAPEKSIPEKESIEKVISEAADEEVNIEQILNELSEEADKKSNLTNSNMDIEDDIDISAISNNKANITQYKVGPLMNVTLDSADEVVSVNLDRNGLKEIFTGSSSRSIGELLKVIKS
jgi:hypothetical protein